MHTKMYLKGYEARGDTQASSRVRLCVVVGEGLEEMFVPSDKKVKDVTIKIQDDENTIRIEVVEVP